MPLRFVTTNPGKVSEAREYLSDPVEQLDFDTQEIQAAELGPIAAHKARAAYRHAGEPVIVDDAGLFIEAFDGFPGPYSSFAYDTLGVDRVCRLTREEDDRAAAFRGVVAYCDGEEFAATPEPVDREEPADRGTTGDRRGHDLAADDRASATTDDQIHENAAGADGPDGADDATEDLPVKLFEGVVPGRIVAPRGDGGFGYDPIFEHDGRTFAEMDREEKNAISHRGRALAKFAEWYAER